MVKQDESVAHAELVGGGETSLHSHTGGGGTDLKPYMVLDNTGGQQITSAMTVNLDVEAVSNANYSLSNDEVTISAAGIYLVSIGFTYYVASTGGAARGACKAWIEDDDSGSYATSPGSECYAYHRETASEGGDACTKTFLLYLANTSKKIRLRCQRTYSTTDIDTYAGTSLSFLKVA